VRPFLGRRDRPFVPGGLTRNRFIGLTSAAMAGGLFAFPVRSIADEGSVDPRLTAYGLETYNGAYTGFSSPQQWTTILNDYERSWLSNRNKKLVLHFHGGLVSGEAGKQGATALLQPYLDTDVFPVFVIWHSGPAETFPSVLFDQGGPIASPHGMLNRGTVLGARIDERESTGTCHLGTDGVEERLRFLNVASGPDAWAFMKGEIDRSFDAGNPFDVFLTWLSDFTKRNRAFPKTTLIGHSAGAIYACRLIQEFDRTIRSYLDAPPALASARFDVMLMAAAVRFDLFNETLELGRISNFRLFTMADFFEVKDEVARDVVVSKLSNDFQLASQITAAYPHSLLYLISGVLEDAPDTPLVGMDRFWHDPRFSINPLIVATKNQLNSMYDGGESRYLVLSKTAPNSEEGYRTAATTHGDFDWSDPETVDSVTHVLKHGFRDGASSDIAYPYSDC